MTLSDPLGHIAGYQPDQWPEGLVNNGLAR